MLAPLRRQKRLHTTEFDGLAICYIRLLLIEEKFHGARVWLDMLKRTSPDHPQLPKLERGVEAGELLEAFRERRPNR